MLQYLPKQEDEGFVVIRKISRGKWCDDIKYLNEECIEIKLV